MAAVGIHRASMFSLTSPGLLGTEEMLRLPESVATKHGLAVRLYSNLANDMMGFEYVVLGEYAPRPLPMLMGLGARGCLGGQGASSHAFHTTAR